MSDRPACRLGPQCPYLVSPQAERIQASAAGTGVRLPATGPLPTEVPFCEWHIRVGLTIDQPAICEEEDCDGPRELPHWVLCTVCGATMTVRDRIFMVGSRIGLTPPPEPNPGQFDHGPYRYRCLYHEE